MPDFQFTDGQVDAITAPLRERQFGSKAISSYVNASASTITEWQRRFPVIESASLAEGRRRLKKIEQHVAALKHEWFNLPSDWRAPLLIDLIQYRDPLWPKECRAVSQSEWNASGDGIGVFLRAFQLSVTNQLDVGAGHSSRNTGRKVKLLKTLAETFYGCFGTIPTSTPGGAFMESVAAIADAIGEPLGKDAVGAGIKAFRKHREFMYGPDGT